MHVARLSILQMSIAFDSYRTRQLLVLSSQTVSYVRFQGEKKGTERMSLITIVNSRVLMFD